MNLANLTTNNNQDYFEPYGISNTCLYPSYTRYPVSELPMDLVSTMFSDAIKFNRYHNEYVASNGSIISEGVDACNGPDGFEQELLENSPIGHIGYETLLILPQLLKINKALSIHNIQTVQSQPAYYNNLIDKNFKSYFQIPFVDFAGPVEAIEIYKQMETDPRLSNCFVNMFYTTSPSGEISIRFFIGRPFIDLKSRPNSGFFDDDFWELICTIAEELGSS